MNKAVLVLTVSVSIMLFSSFMPDSKLTESIKRGKEVYVLYCQNCHMEDGKGTPGLNPPLAAADYLKKPAKVLIDVTIKGQTGEVIVNGKKYNVMMPGQAFLTDVQVADVLNYVRNSWNNKIPGTVTPAMVKETRK